MAKSKYYVVWNGWMPGIYDNWTDCNVQIKGYPHAQYKSFPTEEEAKEAFQSGFISTGKSGGVSGQRMSGKPRPEGAFLCVDAACSGNPGVMEYRGVYMPAEQEVFRVGPFQQGTNNIGEFLALVHGLALLKQKNSLLPVFSDSRNAIAWVKKKKCMTKLKPTPENKPVFDLIERAERWLATNSYPTSIYKWETADWGEIPADFGRK